MSSLSSLLSGNPWLATIAALASVALLWHRFRQGNLRLSKQKTQRLYDLSRKGKWRKAGPIALQVAVRDAFGAIIDDRWIYISMERNNPLRMLADCKNAAGILAVDYKNKAFVPLPTSWLRNYRAWSVCFFLAALAPWVGLQLLVELAGTPSLVVALSWLAVGFFVTPFLMWLSACAESAHRLVHELDKRYPLVDGMLGLPQADTSSEHRRPLPKGLTASRVANG